MKFLSPHFTVNAQSIQWIHDAGSTPFDANEHGSSVDSDTDENAYVLGHLVKDSYFSGLLVLAQEDGCLAKYDAAGMVQWVRTFGGPGFVDIQESSVKVSDSAVYVCGSFRTQIANPTVTFDTISYTYAGNSRHGFLAKYDLNGNIQWMRHGGGPGLGAGFHDIDLDDQGRIVVVGTVDGTNVFGTQTLTYDGGILVRYLANGTLADLIQLNTGSAVHQEAREVEVAPGSGNIYVSGAFYDNITLGGFSASATAFHIFELKLDTAFNCQWLSHGGGINGTWVNGLAIDGNENSYMTGHASGDTIKFGTQYFNGYTMFDHEIITLKLNNAGVAQWLRHGGSQQNDEGWDIITDAAGNSVITGFLGGNSLFATFDGLQVQLFTQSAHCFLARYDANGLISYARVMGGGSDDAGLGLALANDSTFYLTGTAQSSAPWDSLLYVPCCLDPNLIVAKFHDTFSPINSGINEYIKTKVSVYPNPFSSSATFEFNLSEIKNVCVSICDLMGRKVKTMPNNNIQLGTNKITIDLSELNKGIYFCKVKSDVTSTAIKIIKQ